ncbi:MAG: ATP-binding cassette domain-containing protein, partial [Kiritimatiellota bacterium]|nr:ATP-binding cassette domain-containing protein [Kiritimatiellota bacterium]
MAGEYIFTLQRVTKQYNRVNVLDDITLAFYFGAKIGVIGANGSGKSSLLRIIGGLDTEVMGDVYRAKGIKMGHLPQEPQLDSAKTVAEIVEEGIAGERAIIKQYDEICDRLGAKPSLAEAEKLNNELGRLQDLIDQHDLWELDHNVELAMDALRLPPGAAS